jgi:23S rRNA-intervening sequence protein
MLKSLRIKKSKAGLIGGRSAVSAMESTRVRERQDECWRKTETLNAESRCDFVHELHVCLKELKETRRWLRLIKRASLLSERQIMPVLQETEELMRIFFAIRTAEKNAG